MSYPTAEPAGRGTPADPAKKNRAKYSTWEHPKKSGIRISEMPNKTGGKTYGVSYRVRVPAKLAGSREVWQRNTKDEAERLAEDRFVTLKRQGTDFSKIPPDAQRALAVAWSILNEHNTKAARTLDVADVVRAGIRTLDPVGGRKSLAEVFAELRESKAARFKAGGLDGSSERSFRRLSLRLEGVLGAVFVSEVTPTDIEQALRNLRSLDGESLSRRSLLNYRNTLAETFRHATAKQYCQQSPMDNFTREAYKALGGEKPERNLAAINILTLAETRRLLNVAHEYGEEGMLATAVLRLFCGIRTKEVSLLRWEDVFWHEAEPFVSVPETVAKKRRIRHVPIPPNALEWLKLCQPKATGKLDPKSPKTYCKRFGRLARDAGFGAVDKAGRWQSTWETNDTRDSFASYHYALHGDAVRTANLMGHAPGDKTNTLFAHYRTLVRAGAGREYFDIVPGAAAAEKVTEFPRAATG